MKLSVCVDAIYQGKDTCEAMRLVKEAGLDAIEFWSWWDKDMQAIAAQAKALEMRVAAFCTRFISLTDPSRHAGYLEGLAESIRQAKAVGCPVLISQTGADTGEPREKQRDALISGLRACVPLLEGEGVVLAVEPLNTKIDHGGYFLERSAEAFEIIDAVGSENVKILFDIYHQQITEGDVLRGILPNLSKIAHFHLAGNPGRREWDDGELNYPYILGKVKEAGCGCYAGLEYFPAEAPELGLRRAAAQLLS